MKLTSITKAVISSSLILAATTSIALAGHHSNVKGEHVYKDYKDQPVCPPPLMLKDGFYVGAQVGYDSYRVRESFSNATFGFSGTNVQNATGWLGGLFLGYGQNLNNWFYLGAELNANTSNADVKNSFTDNEEGTANGKFTVNSSYAISLLPGVKVTDTLLGYVRLGYNWANLKQTYSLTNTVGTTLASTSKSNTSTGFNFGLGMETLLVDNWSLRTEFQHAWYNSFNTNLGTKINPSDNQYTLGISYHFA